MSLAKEWLNYFNILEREDSYKIELSLKDSGKILLGYLQKRKENMVNVHDLAREIPSIKDTMLRQLITKFSKVGIFKPAGGGSYHVDVDKVKKARVV